MNEPKINRLDSMWVQRKPEGFDIDVSKYKSKDELYKAVYSMLVNNEEFMKKHKNNYLIISDIASDVSHAYWYDYLDKTGKLSPTGKKIGVAESAKGFTRRINEIRRRAGLEDLSIEEANNLRIE